MTVLFLSRVFGSPHMTALFLLVEYVFGFGAVGGWLGCHRHHRAHTAEAEFKADMCDWFRDASDRHVDRAITLEHVLKRVLEHKAVH